MFSRTALSASLLFALAVSAHGQGLNRRGPAMGPVIQLKPVKLEGTVVAVRPGIVALTTATGENWALKIPPKAEVRVTGTAGPDVLRPGIYVRLLAPVDKRRGIVQEKVAELVVFSPSQEEGRMPGVFYPDPAEDPNAAQPNAPQPPVPPPKGAPAGRRAKAKDKTDVVVETFDIRARITAAKGRWLTLYARNNFFKPTLRIELADKPVVKLDVNDYTLAKPGDKIAALGHQIGPRAAQAAKVIIQLAQPVGESGKKPGRTTGRRPPRRSAKQGQGRQSFEVAEEMEQDKPGQNKETTPQEKKEPQPQDKRSKEILQLLQAKPEEIKGKPGVTLKLAEGDPISFTPCKQVSGKAILGRFGLPNRVQPNKGSLPLGEGGQQKEIKWQLWMYGRVLFFVDEADTTRYLAVMPEKKEKEQPQEKQQQPQQEQQREPRQR